MSKLEAIEWYKQITGGAGVDRDAFLDVVERGGIAVRLWDDCAFTLGVEYGALIALVRVFGITKADL